MEDVFYYPAKVIRAIAPELAALFPNDEALLARYRDRYPDSPAEQPYFLRLEISNNSLDWYFTHMLTSSLKNYATQADKGVGLQDSHSTMRLGYGRSLFGLYTSNPGTPPGWDRAARRGSGATLAIPQPQQYERTLCADYIIPGIKLNNLTFASTEDFIRAVDAGMVEEISVGFAPGSMRCDIDGADYWSFECRHIAGFTYDVERDGQQMKLLATVGVGDAQLLEHSVVYAGATPNAAVVRKAEQEAEAGRLSPKQAAMIEERYRVRLPVAHNWQGFAFTDVASSANVVITSSGQPPEERSQTTMDELQQINSLLNEVNATGETALDKVRWLVEENTRLRPLADQGGQYRADLIADTLAEGVRALSDAFAKETYEGIMKRASIEEIKELRANFAAHAAQRFPGGRQTVDGEQQTPAPPKRTVPAAAYRS